MANIKSAEKRIGRPRAARSETAACGPRLRRVIKAYRAADDKEKAKALPATVSEIDAPGRRASSTATRRRATSPASRRRRPRSRR